LICVDAGKDIAYE